MDNNNGQQFNQQYGQPQMQQPYAQPMQQQYAQPMQQQYAQPMQQQYAQPMQQPYGQPMQQPYGQPQMQYGQKQKSQAASQLMNDVKNVGSDLTKKVKGMGVSLACLLGFIGAMLLIFSPFMNIASVHGKVKASEKEYLDTSVKINVADGLNMFELSKLSNTVGRLKKEAMDQMDIDRSDLNDMIDEVFDEAEDYVDEYGDMVDDIEDLTDELEDETGIELKVKVSKGTAKESVGAARLVVKGKLILFISPILLILSGLGLLVGAVVENKMIKFVCAGVPVVCLLGLLICSKYFFSMAGIGVLAMLIGAGLGLASALTEK